MPLSVDRRAVHLHRSGDVRGLVLHPRGAGPRRSQPYGRRLQGGAREMSSPVVNIDDLKLESWERGTLYAGADVRIGPMIGVQGPRHFAIPKCRPASPAARSTITMSRTRCSSSSKARGRIASATRAIRSRRAACSARLPAGRRRRTRSSTPARRRSATTPSRRCRWRTSANIPTPASSASSAARPATHTTSPPSAISSISTTSGVDYWDGEPGAEESKTT